MPLLSSDGRRILLALARQVIAETIVHQRVPDAPPAVGELSQRGAAFVTVRTGGHLRGCVGRTDRSLALGEVVAQCAISAVLRDPRFPPVAAQELPDLEIEISVLSEFRAVEPDAIIPGVHGLFITRGRQHGLLLPQVASEHRLSVERLLAEACGKAGLDPIAWRDAETQLFGFTAEVFRESEFQEK